MFTKIFGFSLAILAFNTLAQAPNEWWKTYDYSQVSAQVLSRGNDLPLLRGRAVKLDVGSQQISAFYDVGSMNLRYVTLGSIYFKGTPWDRSHGGNSLVDGELLFSSQSSLAWTENDNWVDPREFEYAPLPRELAKFKGTYRFNNEAIFHYTVGKDATVVYEMPQTVKQDNKLVFVRHFNIAPTNKPLKLKVIDNPELEIGKDLFINTSRFAIQQNNDGIFYIEIPSSTAPQEFYISYSKDFIESELASQNLLSMIKGGDQRWPETVVLKGQVNSSSSESFVVDQIPLPFDNPYQSLIRFAGFDFFANGTKAAFATWNGDVWIASGLDKKLENITWKRYAAGMNETLGLRIVDDVIYVTGKDQITRLHDLNNNGEADYYENFNNDIKITANFHEFSFGLQTDQAGNFYMAKASPVKAGGRGFDVTHDHHGIVMKVSPDGKKSEIVLSGLRAPGGLSVSSDGKTITTGENEGTYVQACKINYAQKGDFMGVIHPGNGRQLEQGYTPPLAYLPMQADNSGGGQVWVPDGAWGDLAGSLIHLSYGQSKAYTVIKESDKKQVQGGAIALPFKLMSSAMRARFNPANTKEMYIVGFKGWQTNATLTSAINRITYTNKPLPRVKDYRTTEKGIYLTFNRPLNPESAIDLSNYNLERWNYLYSQQYGSAHFATNTSKQVLQKYRQTESKSIGRVGIASNRSGEKVYVTSVQLQGDKKTVFLKIHDMKPVDQLKINYSVETTTGQKIQQTLYSTIYNLAPDTKQLNDKVTVALLKALEKLNTYDLGTKVEVVDELGNTDTFKSRTLNLQVKNGDSISPFLTPGPFNTKYSGFIQVLEKDLVKFEATGNGQFTFNINGKTVLNFNGYEQKAVSKNLSLKSGFHPYTISFKSIGNQTLFSVSWKGNKFPMSPISPHSLRFLNDGAIQKNQKLRDKRSFVANKRCFNCHISNVPLNMPEFAQDSPSLTNIGNRLTQSWLTEWIANPKKYKHNTNMPKLVSPEEAKHIAAYLAGKTESKVNQDINGNKVQGQGLFYDLGCIGCHTRPEASPSKDKRTSLSYIAAKFQPQALKQYLLKPESNYRWTKMPNFNLTDQEASDLASYLYSASAIKKLNQHSGDAQKGEDLFSQNRCANCHSENKSNLVPLKDLNQGCLSRDSDIDLHMSNGQKWELKGFLRYKQSSFSQVSTHEFAKRQMEELQCQTCHVQDDKPSLWDKHLDSVKDLKVSHANKGHLDQRRPSLTYAGEKLTQKNLQDYLSGELGYTTRDWLLAKMPAFPTRAKLLAEGIALQHGKYQKESELVVDPELAIEGEKLISSMGGFSCVICHDIGSQKATAAFEVQGVNLTHSVKRLRSDYFTRWMLNPTYLEPTTKMPKYFDDEGKSSLPSFSHDAAKQIEAMHHYLHTIK
ncbi:c-type cytochrome [Paraglaciecola sp.]|uniref:c-type cytochrome n=1 Tax=Paraglaciecola sp. TaxID=1920173 RepID=UPI003EF0F66C